jgi:DNA polymerase III epsilon subunit-like protein
LPRPKIYVGIDLETSGTDWRKHGIIQVGAAVLGLPGANGLQPYTEATYVSDVNVEDREIDPEATKIHGFSEERMRSAPAAGDVDANLAEFLKRLENWRGVKHRLIAVGWNVAGFDLPFIADRFPRSYDLLSDQTSDLNAAAFLLSDALDIDFSKLKERAKRYAARELGGTERWHDALYDARASLHCREYFRRLVARLSEVIKIAKDAEHDMKGPVIRAADAERAGA